MKTFEDKINEINEMRDAIRWVIRFYHSDNLRLNLRETEVIAGMLEDYQNCLELLNEDK